MKIETKYTFQRLNNYAQWYYFRYYPSNARLLKKLEEKGSQEDAQKIFQDMQHLFQENTILESTIENYIFRHKNFRYIEQKMREKLFPSEKVKNYLQKYRDEEVSILGEDFLKRKIENLLQKGKSKQYIFGKLGETSPDKKLLEDIFAMQFQDGETQALQKEYMKLKEKLSGKENEKTSREMKQKIISKLCLKGFSYEDIKKIMKGED